MPRQPGVGRRALSVLSLLSLVSANSCALGAQSAPPPYSDAPAAARSFEVLNLNLPDLRREHLFDGLNLPAYAKFWEDWRLVTVRFRRDNGEQRFVYANPAAIEAMRSRAKVYPDGAMFGKVAFEVGSDASFPNSEEPRRFTRIQLMKKDSKRYKDSDGWGYAIYTAGSGVPYAAERTTVTACHACHRLVPERDFVFSSPSFMGNGHVPSAMYSPSFKSRFKDQEVARLTAFQRSALARVTGGDSLPIPPAVRSLALDLFIGSVNESVGALSRFASEDGRVYALWDDQHRQFAIARPLPATRACRTRTRFAITVGAPASLPRDGASPGGSPAVRTGYTCNGVWER